MIPAAGPHITQPPVGPGWYPDPNDASAEVYWDGSSWHGRRQKRLNKPVEPTPPLSGGGLFEGRPKMTAGQPEWWANQRGRLGSWWGGLTVGGRLAVILAVIAGLFLLFFAGSFVFQNGDYRQCVRDGMNELEIQRGGGDPDTAAAIERFCEREFGKYIWS